MARGGVSNRHHVGGVTNSIRWHVGAYGALGREVVARRASSRFLSR